MKLLVVAPYFYPKIGGLENYAWNICKGLKNTYGWEIVAVASNHKEKKYVEETIEGIKMYRLPYWLKLSNTPINLGWILDLIRIIKKEKPTVITAHTPVPFISDLAAVVSYFFKIPFFLTYHNDLIKNNVLDILFKLYYSTFGMITFNISKNIITTSQYFAEHSKYLESYKNKLQIIPPGVDIHFNDSIVVDTDLKKQYADKKIVLFVGQLDATHQHKGLSYLIESIEIVKQKIENIKLIVIGKGDLIQEYKNQAKKIDVEFKENIDDTQLVQFYKLSDVVVLPSISDAEGFGMILIEAGACHKPVIGSQIGGIPYVIDHEETGLLTKAKDTEALATNITNILQDTTLAKKMGENGYNKVSKEFSWNMQIHKTDKLFRNI
ncbi:glycosyltransferase family 4 protein [soil metagenome]